MCNKFGNPENDDAYEVFGQKFFNNYNSSQWQKYIAPLVLDDGKQQRAGPSQLRMDKPMTSIFLNYAKLRLWVEENLGACYDEDKINEMKAAGHKAAGARRIANWDQVAEKVTNSNLSEHSSKKSKLQILKSNIILTKHRSNR